MSVSLHQFSIIYGWELVTFTVNNMMPQKRYGVSPTGVAKKVNLPRAALSVVRH